MLSPFLWRQLRRKMPGILIIPLMGLAAGCLLCILHGSELNNRRELDTVYDRIDVPCVVTNLTGTQTDNLSLPSWVSDFFFGMIEDARNPAAIQTFSGYIRDPWAKMTLAATLDGGKVSLVGITKPEADTSLLPENGCEITWLEPYGAADLGTNQYLCLVPEEVYDRLPEEADGSRRLTLSVSVDSNRQDTTPQNAAFTVAGTYTGRNSSIYCPWTITRELSLSVTEFFTSDSIGGFIRNPREIDSFWAVSAGTYFVKPDPSGTRVLWEDSAVYKYYPFALFINDSVLRQTISTLERNQEVLHLLSLVILVLALAIGFMTSFLLLHRREKELALQCVLGVSRRVMVQSALAEQFLLLLAGLALSSAGYFALAKTAPPWAYLGIYLITDGLGAAAALGVFLRRDLTAVLKGE